MKTTQFMLMKMVLILCLSYQVYAQKPEIQVNFDIVKNTNIYEAFEPTIDDVKTKARDILVKGLNDYIGFVNFTTDNVSDKLDITLNKKNVNEFILEYYLFFKLTNADGDEFLHQFKFLDTDEIEGVLSESKALLQKLSSDWNEYLLSSYNKELVNVLFDEIALNLPDNNHYYSDGSGDKEAIIPFKKEMLKIDPERSEFLIIIIGKNSVGADTREKQKEVQFRGLVEEQMMGVSSSLINCIRIGLKALPAEMTLNEGRVYITNYRRKLYSEASEEDDSEFEITTNLE